MGKENKRRYNLGKISDTDTYLGRLVFRSRKWRVRAASFSQHQRRINLLSKTLKPATAYSPTLF